MGPTAVVGIDGLHAARSTSHRSSCLLLVEDDDVDARRIERCLKAIPRVDWELLWARSMGEAIELLSYHRPAVALVDLTLPDASHLDVVTAILAAAPDCPLIVQSGLDDPDTSLDALELGAQDYLSKDKLTTESLDRAIRHAITRHNLHSTTMALRETDAELDDFAHVVAHDLRGPVRTARLLADRVLASLGTEDDMVNDLGARLDEALLRVDSMILSMLDYSSLRGVAPAVESVHLDSAVAEACNALEGDIAAALAVVDVEIDHSLHVASDPALLQRVLINVLSNSLKYRRCDVPVHVALSARNCGQLIQLQIRDNGPGIPPTDRERVFQLLERLDSSQTGLGFGLAICRRVMDTCGGRIWIEAADPPGTTITLEFASTVV